MADIASKTDWGRRRPNNALQTRDAQEDASREHETAAAGRDFDPAHGRNPTDEQVESYQRIHQCDGLADHLRASPHIFGAGWDFVSVVWGRSARLLPYDQVPRDSNKWEYLALEIGNKWSDLAVYRRARAHAPRVREKAKADVKTPEPEPKSSGNPFALLESDDSA